MDIKVSMEFNEDEIILLGKLISSELIIIEPDYKDILTEEEKDYLHMINTLHNKIYSAARKLNCIDF